MSRTVQTIQPYGFAGRVTAWHELSPKTGRRLRLPKDVIDDGALLRLPAGEFSTIVVEGLSERFGNLERFLIELCDRLEEGGELVIDALNDQSPETLRMVLEGRPNQHDPIGSFAEPEHRVTAERLISAASAAGLLVADLYAVPAAVQVSPNLSRALIAEGYMALAYLGRTPPSRHWLRCCKRPLLSGTVLIGSGPRDQQDQTATSLRRFLPDDWQIRLCAGGDEVLEFNREISKSCGELIWLLRAGATAESDLFRALLGRVMISPALPECQFGKKVPADACGLMIMREQLMRLGPIPEDWCSAVLAYEDWRLRMDASLLGPQRVAGGFSSPLPGLGLTEDFDRQSEDLIERWQGIVETEDDQSGAARSANPERRPVPWEGRRPTISLCMITRNEERFLGECLRKVRPVVDEIVIVDTGSTDRTVEIAASHGAKVMHRPWDDDFSAPRNAGIAAATGDWILIIDADEFLDLNSRKELLAAVENPDVVGYHLTIQNQFTGGKTLGVLIIRLFQNLRGARFVNRIHEQVAPSLLVIGEKRGMRLSASKIKLLHYGYLDEVMDAQKKNERNERLFLKHLDENPEDTYILYKYGDFIRRQPRRGEECIAVLEKALELILTRIPCCPRGLPYASEVAALCALECAKRDDFERASELLDQALRRFIPTPNLHYVAAGVALRCGHPDRAIAHYRCCLRYHGSVLVVPIQEGVTSYVSLTGMAMAQLHKGKLGAAQRLLERSFEINPDHEMTILAQSKAALAEKDPRMALQHLTRFLSKNPDAAGACQQAALILAEVGEVDHARKFGERALGLLERDALDREAERMKESLAALT